MMLGCFLDDFGMIWGWFGDDFGMMFKWFVDDFGMFFYDFGMILGWFWNDFGMIFAWLLDDFGMILEWFWDDFKTFPWWILYPKLWKYTNKKLPYIYLLVWANFARTYLFDPESNLVLFKAPRIPPRFEPVARRIFIHPLPIMYFFCS